MSQLADAYPEDFKSENGNGRLDAILKFTIGRTDPLARPVLDQFVKDRNAAFDDAMLTDLMLLITSLPEYQLC
jgi:hypothetical protein